MMREEMMMKHLAMNKFVATAASFTDIDKLNTDVQGEIAKVVELGFFNDAKTFNPGQPISRGQAALTLARYLAGAEGVKAYAEKEQLEKKVVLFEDIPASYKNGSAYQQELFYAALIVKYEGAFSQTKL